jgi:hypothetical protein
VQLDRDHETKIDIADIPLVEGKVWKWGVGHGNGQAYRLEGGRMIYLHRELLGLHQGDGRLTDHINHDTLDNRRSNIRPCTASQNAANYVRKPGSSLYRGVSWSESKRRWVARICVERQVRILGYFIFQHLAARAYNAAATEAWGEFAILNEV